MLDLRRDALIGAGVKAKNLYEDRALDRRSCSANGASAQEDKTGAVSVVVAN
jgi:hypothetical protein